MAEVVGYWDYTPALIKKNKSTYTEAQRKATLKYKRKNRERINEQQRIRHGERMRTDWDYRTMKANSLIKSNKKRKERVAKIHAEGIYIINDKAYELKEIIDSDSDSDISNPDEE